jgi:hypothetical protein
MKKTCIILLFLAACRNGDQPAPPGQDTTVISYDTIPEIRNTVKTAPAASFSIPVKDELNDWKFAVYAYETRQRFRYLLRMQYKELRVTDSINIPNFGIEPRIGLRKGPETYSCIIGFYDKKGEFREYKKAFVQNDQFRFTTLKRYYLGVTRK